jgi:hypothetical protein
VISWLRPGIAAQGVSSVLPFPRAWHFRFNSPESPKVRKNHYMAGIFTHYMA